MKTTADLVYGYTRAEVLAAGNGFPERGPLCPRCKTHIPQFMDLSDAEMHDVRQLALNGHSIEAMTKLRSLTGCSIRWAKIWVLHGGEPQPLFGETPPCPHCSKPLRTSLAKQCRFCHADWHDPKV